MLKKYNLQPKVVCKNCQFNKKYDINYSSTLI